MKKQKKTHEGERKQISVVAYKHLMADFHAYNRKERAKKVTKKQ